MDVSEISTRETLFLLLTDKAKLSEEAADSLLSDLAREAYEMGAKDGKRQLRNDIQMMIDTHDLGE